MHDIEINIAKLFGLPKSKRIVKNKPSLLQKIKGQTSVAVAPYQEMI